MATIEERVSKVEANIDNVFHQLTEIKTDMKDLRQLTVAVEKVATKVNSVDTKLDDVNSRLTEIEKVPATRWEKYRTAIITSIISVIVGALIGGLIALLIK